MPDVSARFRADFTSFVSAVDKAVVQLKTFDEGASTVNRNLARFGNDFSGVRIVQQATLMTKAIADAGGATVLTDRQLQNAAKSVGEASEKMRKMGIEVPPGFTAITDAAKTMGPATDGAVVSFGKLVASWVSAQAIIGLLKTGFHDLVGFVTDSVKAASEAEKAHTQLVAALRAQGTAIPSVISAYQGYARELQRTTIFQDDAIEGAIALMVQIGNVMPRDMEKALKATTNLASGLGIDLETATRLVAKAAEGNVTALQKTGVQLDEATKKSGDFGKVLDAINAKFGGQAVALAGTYQGRLAQLSNTWNNVEESIGRVITQNATLLKAFALVNGVIDQNTGELTQNQTATNLVSDAVILSIKAFTEFIRILDLVQTGEAGLELFARRGGQALANLGIIALEAARGMALLHGDLGTVKLTTSNIAALEAAVKTLGDANQRTVDRSTAFGNTLSGIGAKADVLANELAKTRGQTVALTDVTDGSANAWARQTKGLTTATTAAQEAAKVNAEFAAGAATLDGRVIALNVDLALMGKNLQLISHSTGLAAGLPRLLDQIQGTGALAQGTTTLNAGTFFARQNLATGPAALPTGISASPAGVFDGLRNSLTSFKREWLDFGKVSNGVMTGFVEGLGHMLSGGVTSLISRGIGLLAKGIKNLFGASEESSKVSPLRDAFFQMAGGLETLNPKVLALTGNLSAVDAIFKAKTVDQYNAALKNLTDILGFQDTALADLTTTAQKYGFTLEELGPALQKQNLDQQAQALYKDFQVLTAGGLDNVAVLTRMSDATNAYLQNALKLGLEVPSAMRPLLEAMAQQGTLTDAAGNKISNLEDAGISFALTMSDGFKALIGSVEKLTNAIAVGLGLAITQIPEPTITVHTRIDTSGLDDAAAREAAGFGGAMGGLVTAAGIQHFGTGGRVLSFRPRGTDTVPAMLTPGETVRTVAQESDLKSLLQQILSLLRRQPEQHAIATRDAIVTALRRA